VTGLAPFLSPDSPAYWDRPDADNEPPDMCETRPCLDTARIICRDCHERRCYTHHKTGAAACDACLLRPDPDACACFPECEWHTSRTPLFTWHSHSDNPCAMHPDRPIVEVVR